MPRAITPSWKSDVNLRGNRIAALETAAQPEFGRLKFQRTKLVEILGLIAESRQRIQRERIPVEVVLQIENAREARAGEIRFAPGAIAVLLRHQGRNRLLNRGIVRLRSCQQSDQSPSGLRGRAI